MRMIYGARQTGKTARYLELLKREVKINPEAKYRLIVRHGDFDTWNQLIVDHGLSHHIKLEFNPKVSIALAPLDEATVYDGVLIDSIQTIDPQRITKLVRQFSSVEHWLGSPFTLVVEGELKDDIVRKAIEDQPHEVAYEYLDRSGGQVAGSENKRNTLS